MMWRVSLAVRQCPKYFFTSPTTFLRCRMISSANPNVKWSNDSRPENQQKHPSLKPDDVLSSLRLQQESLLLSTSALQPITSALTTPRKSSKQSSQSRPVIGREGYSISLTLRAFVEACDVISDVPLALKFFRNIHSGIIKYKKGLSLDISLYHLLLRTVAKRGNLQVC